MRFSLPRLRMPQLSLPRLRLPRLPGMFIFAWLFAALKGWVMGSRPKDNDSLVMYDRMLLWLTFGLAAIGFIMVTSASMPVGQRLANDPFLFAKRDGLYIVLAFVLALVTLRLPMDFWQRHSTAMLIASIVMLLIVLVVGSSVNGASRWIALGPLRMFATGATELSQLAVSAQGAEDQPSLRVIVTDQVPGVASRQFLTPATHVVTLDVTGERDVPRTLEPGAAVLESRPTGSSCTAAPRRRCTPAPRSGDPTACLPCTARCWPAPWRRLRSRAAMRAVRRWRGWSKP